MKKPDQFDLQEKFIKPNENIPIPLVFIYKSNKSGSQVKKVLYELFEDYYARLMKMYENKNVALKKATNKAEVNAVNESYETKIKSLAEELLSAISHKGLAIEVKGILLDQSFVPNQPEVDLWEDDFYIPIPDSASLHSEDSGFSSLHSDISKERMNESDLEPDARNSASLHSEDSDFSSLHSDISKERMNESDLEPDARIETDVEIDTGKQEALAMLKYLREWVANADGLRSNEASLNAAINRIINKLNQGLPFIDSNSNPLNFIADTFKDYFCSQVSNLTLFPDYEANKEFIKDWINGNFIAICQGEQEGLNSIFQLVGHVSLTDYDIKEFEACSNAFQIKFDEFVEYQTRGERLSDALVNDPSIEEAKKSLKRVMDCWDTELKNFELFYGSGHFRSPELLNERIDELRVSFEEQYKNLVEINHYILQEKQEKLLQAVVALKASTEYLQVVEGSELMQEKERLLTEITTLLSNISAATPENREIQGFQVKYDCLAKMVDVQSKICKLKRIGNEVATNKAEKLSHIKAQVLTIKEKMDKSNDKAEIKQAIDEARAAIQEKEADISVYRSQWGSKFIFGIFGKKYLESRVASKVLINALSEQLDNFERQLESFLLEHN